MALKYAFLRGKSMNEKEMGLYMELGTLGNFARNTAASMEPSGRIGGRALAAEGERVLESLKEKLSALQTPAPEFAEAAAWFSDNWYIAEREGKDGGRQLLHAGRLPRMGQHAVVTLLASALVRSGRGEVTVERLRVFLEEVQRTNPISQRELAVFVPTLKLELTAFLDSVLPARLSDYRGDGEELAMLLRNAFTSLRTFSTADVSELLEAVNPLEQLLRQDPAGVYPLMDEETRRHYCRTLARLAEKAGISEREAARVCLRLCQTGPERHVGYYIFTRPLGKRRRARMGLLYIGLNVLLTLAASVMAGVWTGVPFVSLLLLIPISEIAKNLTDFVCLRVFRPQKLPRMALEKGVPDCGRTVCVISALLTGEQSGEKFARLLEEYRLLNRDCGENLLFGILADLREHGAKTARTDGAVVASAKRAVDALNEKYGGGFFLFLREREYSEADGCYMARERKRGAISALVELLSGGESNLQILSGDREQLKNVNYIITLDADTRLTAESAREMIGAALHPLNVPEIDEKRGRVVRGYGILQPRVSTDLPSAGQTDFARIFAGRGGVDPYNSAVGSVYQDLCGEGTFMGKGLINVPVYKRVLASAFPDNCVLSHDILEGAYLRCGFLSDTELSDGFPGSVAAFLSRQERWTRGDWQNVRWLLPKVRTRDGAKVKNRLGALNRWKLFDNLRRSLVPASVFVALMFGMLFRGAGLTAAAVTAVAAAMSGLLLTSAEVFFRHDGSSRARYQSAVISGLGGAIMQTAIRLLLLPAEGVMQLRAVCTAVYRMTVTHRGLLQWVTSAESEGRKGTLLGFYRLLAACPVTGLAVMALTPYPAAAAVGLVWLFAPAYAWALSRPVTRRKTVSRSDRSFLLTCAGDIWKFFAEHVNEENHFLPPDNVQTEPHLGPAHRTSPTNIGLCLLAAMAAADLGLVTGEEAVERVSRTLRTVERMEKWNGHLYNWYDTRTLKPLSPRYVSTVDSGNLAACLIALTEALRERGETELAALSEKLAVETDFRPLYDSRRRLFTIGWDAEKNAPTEGWYDLLASEARTASFVAIALGQVPRRHWRRLGRALVSQDCYSGMASWTGTMFEYLMPNLLLPCYEDSLLYESSKFCLYAQKRAHKGLPWGISESAFYAFDPGLSYQYKAHGAERLALKRGMGRERVIAPYATFLALPLDPRGAVRNLRRLSELNAVGPYGYFEAVDFTPSRVAGRFEVVRTFMAHHLGMSLIAVANTLCEDVFPRRFMGDVRMRAFSELLEERVPTGSLVLRQPPRDVPEKPRQTESPGFGEAFAELDPFRPRCVPLGNGVYSVLAAETGKCRSQWRGLDMTRFDFDPAGPAGASLYLRTGEELWPLQAAPDYDPRVRYEAEFSDACARFTARFGTLEANVTMTVPPSDAGELRAVELSGGADGEEAEILCVFDPVLQRREDYEAHPAFSRLSLEAELSENTLVLRRRKRGDAPAVYLAVGCSEPMQVTTDRERGAALWEGTMASTSPVLRPVCAARVRFRVGSARVCFVLAPAYSREECIAACRSILCRREGQTISRLAASALMLSLNTSDVRESIRCLTALLFAPEARPRDGGANFTRERLWKFGISGDLPILSAAVTDGSRVEAAQTLVRRHALLSENGVESDLVLLITDAGDYRSAQRSAVADTLRRIGREGTLNARGGVCRVDAGDPDAGAVTAFSRLTLDLGKPFEPARTPGVFPQTPPTYQRGSAPVSFRLGEEGQFLFTVTDTLPPMAWSHVLTNGRFGYLATEAGTGYMWYENARQMKLNRWLNDPLTTLGTERLFLQKGEERISLFADGDGRPTLVEYGFGYAVWQKELGNVRSRLTAFVPENRSARVLLIQLSGEIKGYELGYFTELTMGEENRPLPTVETWEENGVLCARNPGNAYRDVVFRTAASEPPERFTMDRDAFLAGSLDGFTGSGRTPCVSLTFPACRSAVIAVGCEDAETLRTLARPDEALRELETVKAAWKERCGAVQIETPCAEIDSYVNGWAVYQTLASRVLGRTALYQNGGAIGFRDQLQDVCALTVQDPSLTASHIRLAAAHQYAEGDVMHWWHPGPEGDRGVRTRCSDDLLWLPYVLCDYVEKTGDRAFLREEAPWLLSPPLREGERDRYESAVASPETATLLEHAVRAATCFLERGTGSHGLALMLGGDWNDGMDRVGEGGSGESVWLTWFASLTLRKLSELSGREGDRETSERFEDAADSLRRAGERSWTGDWYLRGRYDDGSPLGAPGAEECELDSIAQSFAVFAGGSRERSKRALDAVYAKLFDRENRVVRLFAPSFDEGVQEPGYIKSYAPGYRENGGQYTHGAVWLAMALLRTGDRERGAEILQCLSPWGRDTARYRTEPYVLAADVYEAPGQEGRGGWTWYTGSAAWYYRAVTEELFGLRVRDGVLFVEPALPESWGPCRVRFQNGDETLEIAIDPRNGMEVKVNGKPYKKEGYPLKIHKKSLSSV